MAYLLILSFTACDYLEVEPMGQVIPQKTSEYRALLTTAYYTFPKHKKLLTLRADEVFPTLYTPTYSSNIDLALLNDFGADPASTSYPWQSMYKVIFYANSVNEGVMEATLDSWEEEESPEQLKGEALLLRAYVHFELLNLYAKPYQAETASSDRGIPLSLTVDVNNEYYAATVEEVYQQILSDIHEGYALLKVESQPAETRYRFSQKAAKALDARVRLYRSEWSEASRLAEALLPFCPLEDMNATSFTAPYDYRSKESILALELTGGTDIADDTDVLPNLINKYKEGEDHRLSYYFRSAWGSYRPDKCYDKSMKVTFRNAEIYLIAAEAAAHINGKLELAKYRLKQLLEKRLTPNYYAEKAAEIDDMTQAELIAEIADERFRELALEGHRWYDLRRTNRPRIVKEYYDTDFMPQAVVIEENDSRYVIPFPREATEGNPNLNH